MAYAIGQERSEASLGFGLLRAGRFAAYVPSSVIKGMLAAIGLMLIIKQVPLAAGFTNAVSNAATQAAGTLDTPCVSGTKLTGARTKSPTGVDCSLSFSSSLKRSFA